jgi:hypothetical protein
MRFYTWSSEEEEDENTNEETRQNASRGRGRSDPVAGEPWRRRAKRPNTSRALQSSRAEVGTGETRLVPRGSCNHQKKAENGEVQRTTHALVRERLDVSVTRVCLTRYEQYCRGKKKSTVVAKKIVSMWRVVSGQPKSDSLEDLPGRSGASSRLF